ncbi:carboxypeptidase regulatory-like domain-containing protein [Paenibacillus sp.]|uniref:carboxypeptidase regulatory-like domain-containing protein n=1 Tax=Paenibacillus sp. TaxID=58172 RepID=UPI002811E3A1|nr:carboxypeptidase regulatory-like domain-containing protein [Paenibacillus sp.]
MRNNPLKKRSLVSAIVIAMLMQTALPIGFAQESGSVGEVAPADPLDTLDAVESLAGASTVGEAVYGESAGLQSPPAEPMWTAMLPVVTKERAITLSLSTSPNAMVTLYANDAPINVGGGDNFADTQGQYSFTYYMDTERKYVFRATAQLGGLSSYSSPAETSLDVTPPAAPADGEWTSAGPDRVSLRWENEGWEEPFGYAVYRNGERIGTTPLSFYEDVGLPERSSLVYEIASMDAAGNESERYEIVASTRDADSATVSDPAHLDVERSIVSADGSTVAYVHRYYDELGYERLGLYIRDLVTNELVQVPIEQRAYRLTPSISGDGRKVAFSLSGGEASDGIYLYDRSAGAGATPELIYEGNGAPVLSPDAETVYIYEQERVSALSVATGEQATLFEGGWDIGMIQGLDVSPDGTHLVYERSAGDGALGSVALYNLETKQHTPVAADAKDGDVGASGRYVVLLRQPLEEEALPGIFLYDTWSPETPPRLIVSDAESVYYSNPMVSGDGKQVVVEIYDSDPVVHESLDRRGYMYFDLESGASRRIGDPSFDHYEMFADFSANGRLVFVGTNTTFLADNTVYTYFPEAVFAMCPKACGEIEPPPVGGIAGASWAPTELIGGQAKLGSDVSLELTGAPNAEVVAFVTFMEAGSETPSSAEAPLAETTAGAYAGKFPIAAGMTEIRSVRYRLKEKSGATAEREVAHPIGVSGEALVSIDTPDPEALYGGKLIASGGGMFAETTLSGPGPYALALRGGGNYKVALYAKDGRKLADTGTSDVRVNHGQTTNVALTAVVPATANIRVVDERGEGVSGVPVAIYSPNPTGPKYTIASGATDASGRLTLRASTVGATIQVVPYLSDPYAYAEPLTVVARGANDFTFVTRLKTGTVQGVVKDEKGAPVANAMVSVTRTGTYDMTMTDEQGRYSLAVPIGHVRVEAAQTAAPFLRSKTYTTLWVLEGKTATQDLTVYRKANGNINVKLSTQFIGSEPAGIDISWRSSSLYSIRVTDAAGRDRPYTLGDNQLLLVAEPGETLTVCADAGAGHAFGSDCEQVTLDDKRLGSVELLLKEHSAVQGDVKVNTQIFRSSTVTKMLYPLDENGRKIGEGRRYSGAGAFELSLPSSGEYLLETTATAYGGGSATVVRQFRAVEDGIVELGEIELLAMPGPFGAGDGNRLSSLSTEAVGGQSATFRGLYFNGGDVAAQDARLLIEVPSGASLPAASVTVNGEPAEARAIGASLYEVTIGVVEAKGGGSFQYRLDIEEMTEEALLASARMRYVLGGSTEAREDIVGEVRLPVAVLTLNAPDTISDLTGVAIGGRAPSGADVMIYDGDVLIGQAQASPGGYWNAKVTLQDRGINPKHLLTAQATANGRERVSAPHAIRHTPGEPVPVRFTVQREGSSKRVFEASAGTARFTYIALNDKDFYYTVEFDRSPDTIKHVVFYDDSKTYAAVRVPGTNVFMAKGNALKPMRLAYDVEGVPPVDYNNVPTEEIEKSLPDALQGFDYEVVEEGSTNEDTGVVTSPKIRVFDPNDPEIAFESIFRFEPVDYTPTEPVEEGMPEVYEAEFTINKGTAGVTIQSSAILSARSPEIQALAARTPELRAMLQNGTSELVKYTAGQTFKDLKPYGVLLNTARQALVADEKMDELERLMQQVENASCLGGDKVNHYAGRLVKMADQTLATLVWQYTMTLAGIGLAWSGFGAPVGLAVAGLGMLVTYAHNKGYEEYMDKFKQDLAADIQAECNDDENDDEGPGRQPGTPPTRPNTPGPDRKWEYGDPTWLFDPSGYVYEAVPGNRVEGAKASLYEWIESEGEWRLWNASDFGQINPQTTDPNGKYGWDVPPGKWQVVYEKDGYEETRSEELIVLPPHFDVNIPLVSYAPARVEAAYETLGAPGVRIDFTKYLDLGTVTAEQFQVVSAADGGETDVPVAVEPIDAYDAEDGRRLAKSVRLTAAEGDFPPGATLNIRVSRQLETYAGVPMLADAEATVVLGSFPRPAESATNVRAVPAAGSVHLLWDEAADASASGDLSLEWGEKGAGTTQQTRVPRGGFYTVEGLQSGKTYAFRLATVGKSGVASEGAAVEAVPYEAETAAPDVTPPKPVANVAAALTDGRIVVSWTDPDDPDLFRVKLAVQRPGEADFGEPATVAVGAMRHVVERPVDGVYRFRLTAVDVRGNESAAATAEAVVRTEPPQDTTPPSAPGAVRVATAPNRMTVEWQDPADADLAFVEVQVKKPNAPTYEAPIVVRKGAGILTFTGLPKGTYQIRVTAVDGSGNRSAAVAKEAKLAGSPWGDLDLGKGFERQASGTFSEEAKTYKPFGNALTLAASEGTFDGPTEVKVVRGLFLGKDTPVRLLPLSQRFEISGSRPMAKPIAATFQFTDFDLPWTTSDKLALYRLDDAGVWHSVGGLSSVKGVLTAQIAGWGTYAVMRVETLKPSSNR